MAGITKLNIRGTIRLYRTYSYRDSNNKPQHNRKLIGKIDSSTGKYQFNDYFIDLITNQGLTINQFDNKSLKEISKIVDFKSDINYLKNNKLVLNNFKIDNDFKIDIDTKSTINNNNSNNKINKSKNIYIDGKNTDIIESEKFLCKSYGPYLLLTEIIDKTGLLNILEQVFGKKWKAIVTLAFFLVCKNEPLMYCQNWIEETENFLNNRNLKPEQISEIFSSITYSEIMSFYDLWMKYINENKYLAIPITSISSNYELLNNIEYVYNRDGEKLPQINLYILFGEESSLPIYLSTCSGSIKDISTLHSFIKQFEIFTGQSYCLVMDKSFYSVNNINLFLKSYSNYNFIIEVPFTSNIAKKIVCKDTKIIDDESLFIIGHDIINGYTKQIHWGGENNLYLHVYYNSAEYNDIKIEKFNDIFKLKEEAENKPERYIKSKKHNKYLIFTRDNTTGLYKININTKKILYDIRNAGRLIIISNNIENYINALKIYQKKIMLKNFLIN